MNKVNEDGAILTPIYKDTEYQYHECSECKSKLYFEEAIFVPLYFEETEKVKFCPYCGKEIIRVTEPKYEVKPNFEWLDVFQEILNKTDREIEYEIFCKMDREKQKELIDKCRFGEEYFGSCLSWNDKKSTCEIVKEIAHRKPHYSYINRLKNEFKNK